MRLTLPLAAVCLLALSAGVLGSSVTLVNGTTHDAQLVGFFTFNGVDHFVFQMADGSLMAYSRTEIAAIEINPSKTPTSGIPPGQATHPPAGTEPSTATQPPVSSTPPAAVPAPRFELSGTWSINANRFIGELMITQSGTTFSGTVLGDTLASGRVQPEGTVSFERIIGNSKQIYTGKIIQDATGILTIQGAFDCFITGGKSLPWSAVLTKPSAVSATPALPPTTTLPPTPQPEYLRAEREPNNDIASAKLIAVGTDVTGAISTNGDVDVYRVTVPTHGTFHVTCTQPADFYMAILNEAGTQIAGGDLGTPGKTMVLDTDVFEPGNYYVLVRGYSSSHKSDTPYTLRAEFREARDAFEPNDSIQQASTVVSGRQFDSFIYRPGDVDFYRIDVSWPSTIKVKSTQPADYHLSIVDSSGAQQLYGGDLGTPGQDMFLEGDVYESGTYYVVMRGYSTNYHDMHNPYTMTITVTPGGPDRFEPNDAPEQASVPPLGQPFSAFISRPVDKDYYKVNITGPSQIVVESDQPADYWMGILHPDGATALAGDDFGNVGTPMAAAHYVFEPGVYYVLMRGYGSSAYNMHTPYNMKIQVKPALHDSAEPNDSASQARGLQLGQPVTGVIPTDTDQDWWYFDTPLLGKVRITCTQPADFRLRVVDSIGKEITNQDLGSKGTLMDLTLQLVPMARYYVVVQPWSKGHFNMHDPYQLTVSPAAK